jgi:hypothetical protein
MALFVLKEARLKRLNKLQRFDGFSRFGRFGRFGRLKHPTTNIQQQTTNDKQPTRAAN